MPIGLLVALMVATGSTQASSPPAGTVTVPSTTGQTATDRWTGTIPPGANPTSDCFGGTSVADEHVVTVTVPSGVYSNLTAQFTFSISWTPTTPTSDTADEIITVVGPDGKEVGSSDSSSTTEQVIANDLPSGDYHVLACGFANAAAQSYSGSLAVTTKAREPSVPSADAKGLAFSAAVPADNQRDEAEPLIETDKDGNIYTCGPTGFSNAADYAQVSTDGGKQFHMLGTPPRGQQGVGGGGDCGIAMAVARNGQQHYQYAYTGLGPLTGFVTSTSPNNGHSLTSGGPFGNGVTDKGGGADRQWMTFIDDHTVLLSYNQQAPRNVVVQRSTDGGLTYGPSSAIAAPDPRFPGPMRYDESHRLVFFGWDRSTDDGDSINLSVSKDGGLTWTDCRAAVAPANSAGFVTADSDSQGNIYIAYGEEANYHTYMVSLAAKNVAKCSNPADGEQPTINPGFSAPVQVDRNSVRTTVFPWIAAGGDPGRVAVSFYGTTKDGNPNSGDFKASWDVYVNQSLNALAKTATFSQVKATTHPFHYDSICLNGLGCDLSVPPGDRTLADFFAIEYNRVDGKLSVVFNRTNKKPDEPFGHVATPMVTTQIAGPSNGGRTLSAATPVVRTSSSDATNDALSSYSLLATSFVLPPTKNERSADFTSVSVGPQVDLATGRQVRNGGFTVTMKVANLSSAALQQEMTDTGSQSLLWLLRFTNGYQDAAASARWNPAEGFTFGFNDYTTGQSPCVSGDQSGEKCVLYPGGTQIQGKVDQAAGTIRLSVPRSLLHALGPADANGRPTQVAATAGSRFYDATAFSLGNNASPRQDVQSFLYPLDNAPAMDFLLPGG
ncbi:MAG TPA: sialidase family protein [Solirubrobacteraceae bacterium]